MKSVLVSGHNPMTGPRHIGHLVSTMAEWPLLQDKYETFVVIDDLIACMLYPQARKKVVSRTFSVAREFYATGIKRGRTHVVLTSMVPEIHELAFFTGSLLDLPWVRSLHEESFCGLLGSHQRSQLGLPRQTSITEAVYPQLAFATMTVGLGARAFQGGEEMKGYLPIIDALCDRADKGLDFHKPEMLTSPCTFLVGTDGRHMASENAVYVSAPERDIRRDVANVTSADVFRNWYEAFGRRDLADGVKDPLSTDSTNAMVEFLTGILKPFRDFKMSNGEIVASLEDSALIARERLAEALVAVKRVFSIPGYS
jgi:tryptophanyl-tRNA synthetase